MRSKEFDIESKGRGHPIRGFIYGNPLSRFLTNHLSIGDILAEAFYGVWMAAVSTGLIFGFSDPSSPTAIVYMIIVALSVNATWGLIDGWTTVYGPMVDDADNDRVLRKLWRNPHDNKAREWIQDEVSSEITRNLDGTKREKVMGLLVEDEPQIPENKVYRASREDRMVVVSLILVEVLVASMVVLPFILFPGEVVALMLSRAIVITIAGAIAYWFARRLNRRHPILWVAVFAALLSFVLTFSYVFGW